MLSPTSLPAVCRRARGSTLVVAVFVVALLAALIGLAVDYTSNTGIAMRRARDTTNAQMLANGALEALYQNWYQWVSTHQAKGIPKDPDSTSYTSQSSINAIASTLQPTLQAAMASSNFTLSSLTLNPVDRTDAPLVSHYYSGTKYTGSGTQGAMNNVPSWVANSYNYYATVVVSKTNDPSFRVTISRNFQQYDASLFQAMLFFQNDLELHPGPNMTLYGLVHTNSNMYAVAGNGGGLTFSSNVSFTGSQNTLSPASTHPNNFYQTGTANTGGIQIPGYFEGVTQSLYNQETGNWGSYKNPVYSTSMSSQLSQVASLDPLGIDTPSAVDPNNGNASGTHEIIERPVPTSKTNPSANPSFADPDAFAAHRIFNSAGLRVIINRNDATQKVHVYTPTSLSNPESSTEVVPAKPTDSNYPNIANQIIASVTVDTTGSIYDFREGRTINADTVDMSVLTPALNAYAGINKDYLGTIYITDATNADSNGNTGNSDAIRLKKGGVLPDIGLTVATDGAIYVQGDYNTGSTYGADGINNSVTLTSKPTSDSTPDPYRPTDPSYVPPYTVGSYTQKPASVMGDAVMILSNAWSDDTSSTSLAARNATPTTMNAAIVSGQVLTTSSAASGGAHNFPRFLENWSGQNFSYHGSMCELYASTHFTGTYGKSNVYNAPNRRWFFDNNFLSAAPPGNLRSTTYSRGRWVHETNL